MKSAENVVKRGRKFHVTDAAVSDLIAKAGPAPVVFTDDALPGFLVKVSANGATYSIQREVGGRTIRLPLGRHGNGRKAGDFRELAGEARAELGRAHKAAAHDGAKADLIVRDLRARLTGEHDAPTRRNARYDAPAPVAPVGIAPTAAVGWRGVTLAQAWAGHSAEMARKARVADDGAEAPRTALDMREKFTRYLPDWWDKPLSGIDRQTIVDRHDRIAREHGPVPANQAIRYFRAVWNTATMNDDDAPRNPVRKVAWRAHNKRRPIPWAALPAWAGTVNKMSSPIRRDMYWFFVLTGLRSEDCRRMRWEEVNLTDADGVYGEDVPLPARSMHRPNPKGGPRKCFTVPLSAAALDILKRRKAENAILFGDDRGWVWPTRDRDDRITHVREPKAQRLVRGADGKVERSPNGVQRKATTMPSPHVLRHSFATAGSAAGVNRRVLKALLNHVTRDLTDSYDTPGIDELRDGAERIAAFVFDKSGTRPAETRITRQTAGRIGAAMPD